MRLYFNHTLLDDTSAQEAFRYFDEIIDVRDFCRKNRIDLRFSERLWEARIEARTLHELIMENKNVTPLLLIQAVMNGPFFSDDHSDIELQINPPVIPQTFASTLVHICYHQRQQEIVSLAGEHVLSERRYRLHDPAAIPESIFEIFNNKGREELASFIRAQVKFRNIEEVFSRVEEQSKAIVILESARKSARKHDFRAFCSLVHEALMGLEKTELALIQEGKNEAERQAIFYARHHCEISRETSATLKSYGRERMFSIPALGPQLFEWHVKIDGNRTRIHFFIDNAEKKIYIGHCGKHLPGAG